jgi:hypothetical protein
MRKVRPSQEEIREMAKAIAKAMYGDDKAWHGADPEAEERACRKAEQLLNERFYSSPPKGLSEMFSRNYGGFAIPRSNAT